MSKILVKLTWFTDRGAALLAKLPNRWGRNNGLPYSVHGYSEPRGGHSLKFCVIQHWPVSPLTPAGECGLADATVIDITGLYGPLAAAA